MKIQVEQVEYPVVETLRDLYRAEANCQIVRDSMMRRGLSDIYLVRVDGAVAAYAGVLNKYDKDRLFEFYTIPSVRRHALPILREVIAASRATRMQAQTNMPLMLLMLFDCATDIVCENILFEDAFTSSLSIPGATFRRVAEEDKPHIFEHKVEGVGDWMVEVDGVAVATGGALYHYNPPYGDIYMEVDEKQRGKGYGSFLVQELKRICYEAGKRPAARCNVDNTASRNTLQKAGLLPCGRILAGDLVPL